MELVVNDFEILRTVSKPVQPGQDIKELVAAMLQTMKERRPWGLSAIQLGKPLRVIVVKSQSLGPIVIINPEISKRKGTTESNEGCLSLPGRFLRIKRPQMVRVKGFNTWGMPVDCRFSGVEARCCCHEVDHLDGKLIIDY